MLNRKSCIYINDDLGNGFEKMTLNMPDDYEGKVVCTLIRKLPPQKSSKAVLYIHGFHDYFFQTKLADYFNNYSYNFYAIDLRKCGRSILPNQIPYNIRNISEYFADIDSALSIIKSEMNDTIIINGHSTGGLVAALYLTNKNNVCNALILNSPFLEMNKSWFIKKIALPLVFPLSKILPSLKIKGGFSPFYGQSIHKEYKGEWVFNLNWKPLRTDYVTLSWLAAIFKAHRLIKKRLDIQCPILVMSSKKSIKNNEWIDDFKKTDIVLNVRYIKKYAFYLGKNITFIDFENGIHDLILSEKQVRTKVYEVMFNWLNKVL